MVVSRLATFTPLNSLPPTTICFDLVFESFLLLRCFSCPLGRAASASLASSSGVSVSCGFPWVSCARRVVCSGAGRAFLLRCLWRSSVPWRSFSLCVWRLRLWFCGAGCPPFGACPGVRRWASLVASVVRSCSALASSVWSLLPVRSLSLGVWFLVVCVSRCAAFGRQARFAPVCPCRRLPVGFAGGRSVSCPGARGCRLCRA